MRRRRTGAPSRAVTALPVDDETRELVQAGLKRFESDVRAAVTVEGVRVDSIHDLARIIKLVGTVSVKGEPTEDRPHRLSRAMDTPERDEDLALRERIVEPPPEPAQSELPVAPAPTAQNPRVEPPMAAGAVRRTGQGEVDWSEPVEMCAPVRRLWHEGHEDRSVAIFDMVRFFAHKQLPLAELTELVLEYDRRGLGKLVGRDGAAYVRQCYDKITATAGDDGAVAPPCHSLQRMGYCRVGHEPSARCELYDFVFDVERSVEAIPADLGPMELEARLRPVLTAIAERDPAMQGRYLAFISKRFGLGLRDLRKSVAARSKPARAATDSTPTAVAASSDSADGVIEGEIFEDTCCYYVEAPEGGRRTLSSFSITPTMRIRLEDGEVLCGDAYTDKGQVVRGLRLPLGAFVSKRDLVRHLGSADLQWTGSDNNVQGLLRALARHRVPHKPGSKMLGYYERDGMKLWLAPGCAIGPEGFVDPPPVEYVSGGASLDARVNYERTDDDTFAEIARLVFGELPRLNTPEVMAPVIGWFFATPLKPRVMERLRSFPLLVVWGGPGSGKSSMLTDVLWPLFGVRDAEPFSATETDFSFLKLFSATRSVPVFIDEYKPYDMPQHRRNALHRFLRRLYRGESEHRGRADQTMVAYHLQAPVCIAGETRPSETAILERLLTSSPSKLTLERSPGCREALMRLKSIDLSLFAPRYIEFCLGRDIDADLELAKKGARAILAGRTIPLRIADNVAVMILGLHLFEEFAAACGMAELLGDLSAQTAVDAYLSDVLETEQGAKTALDAFVEMLGVMAIQGELRHGVHYAFKDTRLYVHLESAYDAFRLHCKRIDYAEEMVDLKALRRMISENRQLGGYVVEEGVRVYFGKSIARRRAIGIDLERTDLASADDFPSAGDDD